MSAAAAQSCVSSSMVLHVNADGTGHAVVTSHVYFAGVEAFDSLFSDSRPNVRPSAAELLPEPTPGAVEHALGTPVRLMSSTLERAADGGIRRTVVDFDDITRVRLTFPPEFALPSGSGFVATAVGEQTPVITFSRRQHPNGDEMLVLKLPDPTLIQGDPNDVPITKFDSGSREERAFKAAIEKMGIRLTVELEQPLLRTNAPKMSDNGATILDLDMDRMINAMDEAKARRIISSNSFQEVLWQLGDLPGAAIPVDHEVFLEYQRPQPAAPPPAAQTQAPPDTEIYLLPMRTADGTITLGAPANVTNNPGYDNQPFFTADSRSVLFTSIRGGGTQTDIYRYDISTAETKQVTDTPESEYSPTITPSGALAVVRVELDEAKTQRLWRFTADGRDPRVVLENVKPVGYHAWADDHTVAMFILGAGGGAPATLQLADTRTGQAKVIATDIGRSIQPIPGPGATRAISFVQRVRENGKTALVIKELNPATQAVADLTPAVEGSTEADTAWTPDGTLLMTRGGVLYSWRRGQSGWKEVASLEQLGLTGVTRIAVSPRGNWLAVVAAPQTSR
jgi:hypothetical protein